MDNCWVVSTKVQNALPLSQCCLGSRGDQLRREMAGFVTVYVERFKFTSFAAWQASQEWGWVDITASAAHSNSITVSVP
jgi:hypothetical protein